MINTPEGEGMDMVIDALNKLAIGRGTGYRIECPTCGMNGPIEHSPIAASEAYLKLQGRIQGEIR